MGLWRKSKPSEDIVADVEAASSVQATPANGDEEGEPSQEDQQIKKKAYFLLVLVSVLVAILLKFQFASQFGTVFSFAACNGIPRCLGNQVVFRISFGVFVFFLIMAIVCFATKSAVFHSGWWFVKIPLYVALVGLAFVIPNPFFSVYAEIARVVSILFLILQVLILIDMAHDLHEHLMTPAEGADEVSGCAKIMYLVIGFGLILFAVIANVLLLVFYNTCPLNRAFVAITIVMGSLLTFLSLTNAVGKGLLAPAVVFAYATYICWQGLTSNPDQVCNPKAESESLWVVLVGVGITVVSLSYASLAAAAAAPNVLDMIKGREGEDDSPREIPKHGFFHLVLSMAAMFMAMLLTNYGSGQGTNQTTVETVGEQSMWIKMASQWLTFALFLWTLVGPLCCPSRNFETTHNQFEDRKCIVM